MSYFLGASDQANRPGVSHRKEFIRRKDLLLAPASPSVKSRIGER
jgi:hypothetical protein